MFSSLILDGEHGQIISQGQDEVMLGLEVEVGKDTETQVIKIIGEEEVTVGRG